jgi:hypothetical protein
VGAREGEDAVDYRDRQAARRCVIAANCQLSARTPGLAGQLCEHGKGVVRRDGHRPVEPCCGG